MFVVYKKIIDLLVVTGVAKLAGNGYEMSYLSKFVTLYIRIKSTCRFVLFILY